MCVGLADEARCRVRAMGHVLGFAILLSSLLYRAVLIESRECLLLRFSVWAFCRLLAW